MKKILFTLFGLFLLSAVVLPGVFAQTIEDPVKLYESALRSSGPNLPKWSRSSIEAIIGFLGTSAVGTTDGRQAGAVVGLTSGIAAMYANPAATTELYIADLKQNMGIPVAHAQGTGYLGLTPILGLWKVFRNIAYLAFVLIFLSVGFMIMFRFRIDPRTVVTIQNSLPRLIIALLLVTFSFAISGLLIDLMYVTSSLFFNLLGASGVEFGVDTATYFRSNYQSSTPFQLWWGNDAITARTPADSVYAIAHGVLGGGTRGVIVGRTIFLLTWLIIALGLLFTIFRLFFALLMAYIKIILGVIFAPFWIMFSGVPLNLGNLGFGGWMRHMIGHLTAFPTAAGMFLLAAAFMNGSVFETGNEGIVVNGWVGPLLGAGYAADAVSALIGIGLIFLTPAVVRMTQDAFKSPEFKYGAVISQQVASGRAVGFAPVAIPFALAQQGIGYTAGPWMLRRIGRMFGLGGQTDEDAQQTIPRRGQGTQ